MTAPTKTERLESTSSGIGCLEVGIVEYHEQYYSVVPKWLDEEFPLPAKSGEAEGL